MSMFETIRNFFTKHLGLKFTALMLALALWFYIVSELKKGSEEERQFLNRVLPQEGVVAKKLSIMPIFIGRPRAGFAVDPRKAVVVPQYCIVVGTKELLGKIRNAYTMPIDVTGTFKSFNKSVAMNPIAPGVYMEETFVEVTVPVERAP